MPNARLSWSTVGDVVLPHKAFLRSGGLIHCSALISLMRELHSQPISILARYIANREVVYIGSTSDLQLPIFQFEVPTFKVRQSVGLVLDTLKPIFDDCQIALWFAESNDWLEGACPADLIVADPVAVFHAARADHFVAIGN